MPFPYKFPFKFDDFLERWAKFKDIKDSLSFSTVGDSMAFSSIADTLQFTEVTG